MPAQTIRLGRRRHGDNKTSLDGAGVRAADRRTGPQASQKRSFRDEAQCSCYLRLDLRPGWHTYRIRATWVLDTQFAGITWRPRSATREIGAPVVNQRAVGTDNLLIVGRHAKTILDCITLAEAPGVFVPHSDVPVSHEQTPPRQTPKQQSEVDAVGH
jgi:hypothetical protein